MKSCANCLLPETHETITFEESAVIYVLIAKKEENLLIGKIENLSLII